MSVFSKNMNLKDMYIEGFRIIEGTCQQTCEGMNEIINIEFTLILHDETKRLLTQWVSLLDSINIHIKEHVSDIDYLFPNMILISSNTPKDSLPVIIFQLRGEKRHEYIYES